MVKRIVTPALSSFTSLTDTQLLATVKSLVAEERQSTAALIAALSELDERGLYLREGYSSLFAYCTQALHLSEDAAYNRIRVARVAAKWPIVIDMIADGSVTVTAVRLLSDVLTDTNHLDLLRAGRHRSKREVEEMIAALRPQPPVAPSIRRIAMRVPTPVAPGLISAALEARTSFGSAGTCCTDRPLQPTIAATRPTVAPLSADHYKIQFTIPKATHDKLRRVQDLLRHQVPDGDPAVVFDRALTLLLQDLERKKRRAQTVDPEACARGAVSWRGRPGGDSVCRSSDRSTRSSQKDVTEWLLSGRGHRQSCAPKAVASIRALSTGTQRTDTWTKSHSS